MENWLRVMEDIKKDSVGDWTKLSLTRFSLRQCPRKYLEQSKEME